MSSSPSNSPESPQDSRSMSEEGHDSNLDFMRDFERGLDAFKAKLFAKQDFAADIYAGFYCIFGGHKNLLNRELFEDDLQHLLFVKNEDLTAEIMNTASRKRRSGDRPYFTEDEILQQVKEFLKQHLYTSTDAATLSKFFPLGDIIALTAEFGLQQGIDPEAPQEDLPYFCQEKIMGMIYDIIRHQLYWFLHKHMRDFLVKLKIPEWSQFKVSSVKRKQLTDSDTFSSHFKKRNPSAFSEHNFEYLLHRATKLGNKLEHYGHVSTQYLYDAAQTAIQICEMIGEQDLPYEDLLLHICDELRAWDNWSAKNKEESREELREISEEIEYELEWLHTNPDSAPTYVAVNLQDDLDTAFKKILTRREEDRYREGCRFVVHLDDMAEGSPMRFKFSMFRDPLYPIRPIETVVEDSKKEKATTKDQGSKRTSDDGGLETDGEPAQKKRKD